MRKIAAVCLAAILSISLFAPAVYGAEQSTQLEGFYGLEGEVSAVYLYDETRMIAYEVGWEWGSPLGPYGGIIVDVDKNGVLIDMKQDVSYMTALAPKPLTGALGKQLAPIDGMDVLLKDDTKYTYGFYENGITVAKGAPGKAVGKAIAYSVDKKAYQTLLKSLGESNLKYGQAYWLAYMRPSRVTTLSLYAAGKTRTLVADNVSFSNVLTSIREFTVEPDSMQVIKNAKPPKTGTRVTIDFDSEIRYTIVPTEKTITLYVSDRDYALRYSSVYDQMAKLENLIEPNAKMPVDTGKPVIYLYPTTPTDVLVKLGYKGQLATTIPAYEGGWNVTAYPDGRLVNKADGKAYPYLFWDGYDDTDWDFSKGFVVAGADSERFLQEKLAYMGLNATERRDFLEYWLPYLQANAYNQITFATEQYEALAPLAISPAPDSLLRVFMTYRPLERPIEITPQKLERFERKGFAAVEWGGAHYSE